MDGWVCRQLAEIESLQAIFFEEGAFRADEEALAALASAATTEEWQQVGLPPVAISARVFDSDAGSAESRAAVRLAAVLPHGYPTPGAEGPLVWLEPEVGSHADGGLGVAVMRVAEDEALCAQLQATAADLASNGEECLLPLIQTAEELLREWADSALTTESTAAADTDEADDQAVALALFQELAEAQMAATPMEEQKLGRRAMFSHHIIAPSKRQAIKHWAEQLRLGGLAKIGWPGIIIVEGSERNVAAYVEALSRLRWKHFVVRGEQMIDIPPGRSLEAARTLPLAFEEYPPDGMSDFSSRCRQLGVEELFLAALKMGDGAAGAKKAGPCSSAPRKGKKR